jgi:hypothetical protein
LDGERNFTLLRSKIKGHSLLVVGQFERHIAPAAKAALDFCGIYSTTEVLPFQDKFKLTN